METFSAQLEERVLMYKNILDEKQRQLDTANGKYFNLMEQMPGVDIDSEQSEIKRLIETLRQRDILIKTFEEKIGTLSAELIDATSVITKIRKEREEYMKRMSRDKTERCCEEIQSMLEASNIRCKELQEMLEMTDNDNILKAKQAFEAIETLKAYEKSEDGLADALKRIHDLQDQLHQRDKQIQEFVVELNAQNEIVAENSILRKRLGIAEDDLIETRPFLAKQRKLSKINERLMLKLRASEEIRLQLKIEKHEMKRRIIELETQNSRTSTIPDIAEEERKAPSVTENIKQCESCFETYIIFDSVNFCKNCIMKQNSNLCDNCVKKLKVSSEENIELIKKIAKLEIDQKSVTEENENLRIGLNEILEKLRDYEGTSEQTIINPATFEKLLYILNIRNKRAPFPENSESQSYVHLSSPQTSRRLEDAEAEIIQLKNVVKGLSDQNENYVVNLEKMKILEINYEELVRSSELCDGDKHHLLIKSLHRCHEFETNMRIFGRKIDFLKNENDYLHSELRRLKISSMTLINDVRIKFLEKNEYLGEVADDKEIDEIVELQEELQIIRTKLNGLCLDVLKNIKTIDDGKTLNIDVEKLSDVTVLENNFTTSFITRQELESMKSQLMTLQEKIRDHKIKENNLEELTKIIQSQLKSQQLMLSQFTDEEISARHLIVDLQSQSNENYLLTKATRELKISKEHEEEMKLEVDELKAQVQLLHEKIKTGSEEMNEKYNELMKQEHNNQMKIKYLKKTLVDLCHQYSSMTPVYLIADFIKDYTALLAAKKKIEVEKTTMKSHGTLEISQESIIATLGENSPLLKSDIEAKIEIIKHKSSCEYLRQQLELRESTIKDLHNEVARVKLNEIRNMQHWNAIQMLFDLNERSHEEKKCEMMDKALQVDVETKDCSTSTDEVLRVVSEKNLTVQPNVAVQIPSDDESPQPQLVVESSTTSIDNINQKSLESQLKKALLLASSRSALLIETENRLSEAQGRIKLLEKNLDNRNRKISTERSVSIEKQHSTESMTISTLQNLLLEKDITLSRYQDLLKTERQHHLQAYDELNNEMKELKRKIDDHESIVYEKEKIIQKLKAEISEHEGAKQVKSSTEASISQQIQISNFTDDESHNLEMKLKQAQNDIKKMEQQLKDLLNTERQMKNLIHDKDATIKELNVKLKAAIESLDSLSGNFTPATEIDQCREMLEEKDKHIQDLTETLNQFHDDQQKYINDTAINSAEQVHLISADLNRADATNRVLKTQLEAVKRQVANIQQREKQAREMVKTLKNQLIRRPVISVKSDKRPTTQREENLQKKVSELENELLEVKDELRRQMNINDNKKAKNAAELGLWDKQKRYQELSEKLKTKLTEKEIDYERMKANFQIAKNNITRLEREKSMLENKIKSGRYLHNVGAAQQTSCAHCHTQKHGMSETSTISADDVEMGSNHELIAALKSRIETQQRRIISLELDGKGSNAMTTEVERLQEQLTTVESQNIRLEAKNIQLQLDFDLLKQNDSGQRQEARIKHLEDYILVLKDELAQAHGKYDISAENPSKHSHPNTSQIQAMEQTILTLKRVIERLKAENKHLKDLKSATTSTAAYMSQTDRKKEELFEKLKNENEKLLKKYNEMLDKISKLEIELQLSQTSQAMNVSCPHCNRNFNEMVAQDADVLTQQLQQKTALLEKAKTLLARAAAKEKHLREQIFYLKKRVCDLEGVPVISEENSESG
ncbi:CLUMA_CG015577, isoform A [Clunio marinus]|uniref:CLUMA_CG015577, isoform A n=1 Tax=Clunio marinus TaxID=568069 RepID=A0A1J1IPP9_9DIPT|nr:CLUMA_CG015577, isoform A [Clunio marinus]